MEREIKFRAWDIDCNKYRGIKGISDLFSIRSDGQMLGNYVLEQYTGLKDKNGVEIYEGDLLRHTVKNQHHKRFGETHINQVYWMNSGTHCGFRIKGKRFSTNLTGNWLFNQESEVIGNIHEK